MSFTLGSLFDGSGGFPLASTMCGGTPLWASEVEPFPIAVTWSRFPGMKHLGSVTDIKGGEIDPVDVITFGSPCQDLSVAGKRAGLKHEDNGDEETTRSGLFMEAIRIIKEMRKATNGEFPKYCCWENVPGAFSSNGGRDFRTVLEELIKIVEPSAVMPPVPKNGWPYADSYCGEGWSLAYRTFDAQYWGVPQRRRRIYLCIQLVPNLGDGSGAGEILFKSTGLRGYFAEGRTPWQRATYQAAYCPGADDRESKMGERGCGGADRGIAYTLEPGIAAREGGHIYEGVSGTLRANAGDNQMAVSHMVLDDQGGQQITVRTDGKSPTLRAEMHGNVPCVMEAAGFCTEHSAQSRGIGYEDEVSPTLRAGVVPGCVFAVENHPADSRVNLDESGKVQTLTSRMGTGGGNVPMVMEPLVCLEGNGSRPSHKGNGWSETDTMYTLNATEQHAVCIPIADQATRFSGKRGDKADGKGNGLGVGNPGDPMYTLTGGDRHAVAYGFDQGATRDVGKLFLKEQSKTLTNGSCPGHHNGVVIAEPVIHASKASFFMRGDEGAADTLVATDYKDPQLVAYPVDHPVVLDRAFFNQGQNAQYDPQFYTDGTEPTLVARGPAAVQVRYIVRRLTPTECARLQGFADRWATPIHKDDFTDEEYRFWLNVRKTHAAINGKTVKDYTKPQMVTWYNKLPNDGNEYKLWGNGIALPNALYVMQGIADVLNK